MAGAILSSTLTAPGSGYSISPSFNEGFVVQGVNATARYRVDTLTGVGNGVATYTIIDPGSGYTTGAAITSADFAGSGFELNIDAVTSTSGGGLMNIFH